MTVKVAGYVRVSTAAQAETGESLITQRHKIEHYVKAREWQLVDIYEDRGISGSKAENRPAFLSMINDSKDNKFNIIAFCSLSRFARNAREMLNFNELLNKNNVSLVSIDDNLDTAGKNGKLIMTIMSGIAEWEKEIIRERMSENKYARWKENRAFVGRVPYGYVWNNESKKLEINADEAAIYKRIVDMYLKQGLTYRDIALHLRSEGIKSKSAFFSSTMIGRLLKREAYYGSYIVNQFVYEDGVKGAGKHQSKQMKPASEHIRFDIPALITKNTWDEIQSRVNRNKFKTKRQRNQSFWLRDVLICGECSATIKPKAGFIRPDESFLRYYHCHWRSKGAKAYALANKKACDLPYIKADELEDAVWQRLMFFLAPSNEKFIDELFTEQNFDQQIENGKKAIIAHKSELKRKLSAKDRIYGLLEDVAFDRNELHTLLTKNANEVLAINEQIKQAQENLDEIEKKREDVVDWKMLIGNERDVLNMLRIDLTALETDDKKLLIERMLTESIPVHNDHEGTESKWALGSFKFSFNSSVLQELIDEGKLPSLSKHTKQHGHWNRCQACGS
ncbi:recombinase family protein [Candidatus Parcubacteria bacterium]|nr:MAG: recombinase family protein [Candidatus Parcubacteria bacterium]